MLRRLVPTPVLTFLHPYHLCPEVSLRCVGAWEAAGLVARYSQATSSKHYEAGRQLKMPWGFLRPVLPLTSRIRLL